MHLKLPYAVGFQGSSRSLFHHCDSRRSYVNTTEEIRASSDDESDQSVNRHPLIDDEFAEESVEASGSVRYEEIIRSFERFLRDTAFGLLEGYQVHRALCWFVRELPQDLMRRVSSGIVFVSRARCTSPYLYETVMAVIDAINEEINVEQKPLRV